MKKNGISFIRKLIRDYFEAVVALIVFFPYFFSLIPLLKTLFYPWKHIVTKKETRGFSFSEYLNRLTLNIMSSLIGASMRLSLILFCGFFELLYICALPFLTIIYLCIILPIRVTFFLLTPSEEEIKEKEKKIFVSSHCLKPENEPIVLEWFEKRWNACLLEKRWWRKEALFSYPPLARDWAVGYTPTLDVYVEDLTGVFYQTTPRHIVGRKKELAHMQEVLNKTEEANVLLVGEEGVGKRTVVDALARLIYEGQTGKPLAYKRILKLNMEKILTVSTDAKQRELFFEELLREAEEAKSVILLIEDIDKYCASGQGRVDLTTPIEKFARFPTVQFIGITSPFYYQRYLVPNEKMNRLFTRVDVPEIAKQEALATILYAIPSFEKTHAVAIPYETAEAVIAKSEFYITTIPFPEKAIELLDQTVSHYFTHEKNKDAPIESVIMPEYVDIVLTEKTHIPTTLTEELRTKLLSLEHLLSERIIFQSEAISALSTALRRSFILLGKRKKPLATFLFLGPTGVGKTETAKALAAIFFGNERYLTRFDMSLYQSKDDIKTLIGSMESGLPGILTQAIRERNYAVLLLDELEKAHPDLINIFLTVIDEGYFTDGFGKRVDCKNLMIIGTSNAGADFIYKQQQLLQKLDTGASGGSDLGVSLTRADSLSQLVDYLIQNKIYSPEFLNRFDGVIVYNAISDEAVITIARKMALSVQTTLADLYNIHLTISDKTLLDIVHAHYNPRFGARNLEHVVTAEIEDKIATLLLEKKIEEGTVLTL